MKTTSLSLDLIGIFLAVARAGTLDQAAQATGSSAPTLSRKMAQLERDLGARLFERGRRGYALTAKGRALMEQAQRLDELRVGLSQFATQDGPVRVRITAGPWTARYLALNLAQIWSPEDGWLPEFLSAQHRLDIARREADIGIRNARPEQGWLSGQRISTIDYAVFAARPDVSGYIAVQGDGALPPSARWLRDMHGNDITARANAPQLARDMACAGVGRVVLPFFVGHAEPDLVQIGPAIDALRHEEWLVAHHEARHDPPVRSALNALAKLLRSTTLRQCRALDQSATS